VTDYWRKYVGLDGAVVGIDRFGASAPAEALFKYFGFTVDEVVAAAKRLGRSAERREHFAVGKAFPRILCPIKFVFGG